MKFLPVILFAGLSALASAQDASSLLDKLPDCSKQCVVQAIPKNCTASDTNCICNSDSFIQGTTCCVKGACNEKDYKSVTSLAKMACSNFPASHSCSSTATGTAASQTGSAAAAAETTGGSSGSKGSDSNQASQNGAFVTAAPNLALLGAAMLLA